jgi:hypothetical protein
MFNRYQTIPIQKDQASGSRFFANAVYPDIEVSDNDLYVITTLGDRLDVLSQSYYGDVDFWWVIASANSLTGDSLFPPVGVQLRIPTNLASIVNSYKQINYTR